MKVFTLPNDISLNHETPNSDIVFYHYTSLKDSVREKSHLACNAFSLVISGRKTMLFAEKSVTVKDSEIHLLSSGNCIASVSISQQKTFESVLIFFTNQVLSKFYSAHAGAISTLKKERPNSYLEFEKDDFINNYIQSLLLTLRNKKQFSESMKEIKLNELFLYLLENHPARFLSFHTESMSDAELQVRKVVETNKENNLTIEELSFLCNMSPSTFKRLFRKIYNTTPGIWLNEQRMSLASEMLNQKKEKPAQVWSKLGFETHTGFTKAFKKHFGYTPKSVSKS